MIDGQQRLRNLRTKIHILGQRQVRQYLANEIDICPSQHEQFQAALAREFDRLAAQAQVEPDPVISQ